MPIQQCVTPVRMENPVSVQTRQSGPAKLKVTPYHLCEAQLLFHEQN